jgi:uncharacterized protein
MELEILEQPLAVVRLSPDEPLPTWVLDARFFSITRSDDELSIFCDETVVPDGLDTTCGWRAFRVAGTLDLELTGIISQLAMPLAVRQISIFSISTHDTDYMVVRQDHLDDAMAALQRAGHVFI